MKIKHKITMKIKKQKEVQKQLYKIVDLFQYAVKPEEAKNYILGLIFYKYVSDRVEEIANEILRPYNYKYLALTAMDRQEEEKYLKIVEEKIQYFFGAFLTPTELSSFLIGIHANIEVQPEFLEHLTKRLKKIGKSDFAYACGYDKDSELKNLLYANICLNYKQSNILTFEILAEIDKLDFNAKGSKINVLLDCLEFLGADKQLIWMLVHKKDSYTKKSFHIEIES